MGRMIGYARVSTVLQDVETQRQFLLEAGVTEKRIYVDHGFSGKTMTRDGLERALQAVEAGDTFLVPRLDRLARNTQDALAIIHQLTDEGVVFQAGSTTYDPSDPMAKLFLTILAAVAEAEGGWISIRTREALARPEVRRKLRGRQTKRTPEWDADIAAEVDSGKRTVSAIAAKHSVPRSAIYRAVDRHRAHLERSGGVS